MKRNRILIIILCIALAAGLVYGIGSAFAASRSKTVVVVPVSSLNSYWGDYENSMDGFVASGYTQDIYLMDTESVESVLVEQGQQVKEGDILLKYDATQTAINLEREQLSREKLELQMDVARKNLATLQKLKPDSGDDGGGFDFPDFPVPEEPDYSDVTPADRLDEDAQPYNIEEESKDNPLGTEDNPYRYLCSEETVITGQFLNKVRQMALEKSGAAQQGEEGGLAPVYYVLEVREGNTATGRLKRAWKMDAVTMDEAPEGWEGSVNLAGSVKKSDSDAQAVSRLDAGAEPYNSGDDSEEAPLGSDTNPLRFLCTKDAVITGDFLNSMASKTDAEGNPVHYVLEVREGDRADGELLLSWQRQGSSQETYESGKEYVLSFVLQEKEKDPEEEQTDPDNTGNPVDSQNPQDSGDENETGSNPGDGSSTENTPGSDQTGETENPTDPSIDQNTESQEPVPGQDDSSLSGAAMTDISGQQMNLILDLGQDSRIIFTDAEQGGNSSLISSNASYTKEELEQARKDAQKAIRDLELDLRESDLKIKAARKALEEGSVKAQMDGVVGIVSDPENPPTDGTPFLTVISENGQYVQSALNELYIGTIEEGDIVYIHSYMDGGEYEGTVKSVSPYPDTTGRYGFRNDVSYYPMIITVTDPSAKMSDGDYLEVRAEQSGASMNPEETGKIYISKAFIRDENGQKYVFKDNEGKLVRQNVRIGGIYGEGYEILSGVSADDYLAFPYGSSVKDGAVTRQGTLEELYY